MNWGVMSKRPRGYKIRTSVAEILLNAILKKLTGEKVRADRHMLENKSSLSFP